jgi:hypothetical protein
MRPSVFVATIALGDDRQVVFFDLLSDQRQSIPLQWSTDLAFKNAPGVFLDLIT